MLGSPQVQGVKEVGGHNHAAYIGSNLASLEYLLPIQQHTKDALIVSKKGHVSRTRD